MVYYDNKSFIKLTENPFFHDRSKNIEMRCHFIWEYVKRGSRVLHYISTYEKVAYILTDYLGRGKFVFFRDKFKVVLNTFLGKREC